jgi:serine/threonine protein kinase
MHRHQVAHRDIKPENIILANGVVKLCDFGWAADCSNGMRKTFCGTMDYVSPEVLDQKEYSLQVDIWSVGVLAFELIAGFAPFPNETPRFKLDRFTMVLIKLFRLKNLILFSHLSLVKLPKTLLFGFLKRTHTKECQSMSVLTINLLENTVRIDPHVSPTSIQFDFIQIFIPTNSINTDNSI